MSKRVMQVYVTGESIAAPADVRAQVSLIEKSGYRIRLEKSRSVGLRRKLKVIK